MVGSPNPSYNICWVRTAMFVVRFTLGNEMTSFEAKAKLVVKGSSNSTKSSLMPRPEKHRKGKKHYTAILYIGQPIP